MSDEVPSVQLSALIIDKAYQDLKVAYKRRLENDIINTRRNYEAIGGSQERIEIAVLDLQVHAEVELAKAEVERVTTLLTFFQVDSLFKAQEQFGPEV